MKTLPKINHRIWIALEQQARRRKRQRSSPVPLLPAPVLRAAYPDLLQWDWDFPNPYKWNVWMEWPYDLTGMTWRVRDGITWVLIEDYWGYGAARQFAPDGGGELYFIVGVDAGGNEVTACSNLVRPDDAPVPTTFHTNLAGYWKLDEPTGAMRIDSSGFEQHLIDWNDNFPGVAGLLGNAASNDAEWDMKQLSADLLAPFDSATRSVSWWVLASSAPSGNFQIFLSLDGGDFTNDAIQCYTNSGWEFNVEYFGNWISVLDLEPLDSWNHFVATTDGETARLYLNGDEIASSPSNASAPVKLWIGNYYEMDRSMVGSVDEVGMWNRCLSASEVGQLYNFGSGLPFENF